MLLVPTSRRIRSSKSRCIRQALYHNTNFGFCRNKKMKLRFCTEHCVSEQDVEDITDYNDLIRELWEESHKRGQRLNEGVDIADDAKRAMRSTPRPNVLNCRRKAINGFTYSEGSPTDVDQNSPAEDSRLNTWNYRIGGKCTNKWQLFEKNVLENKVVKQLREKRLTDRLIKVLSSTPQRKLRSRKSSTAINGNRETNGNAPSRHNPDVKVEKDQPEASWVPKSTCTGGYCPDIEPTLMTWPSVFSRSLCIHPKGEFVESANFPENQNGHTATPDVAGLTTEMGWQ